MLVIGVRGTSVKQKAGFTFLLLPCVPLGTTCAAIEQDTSMNACALSALLYTVEPTALTALIPLQ